MLETQWGLLCNIQYRVFTVLYVVVILYSNNEYYEFIDMNTFDYKKINFKNGIKQSEVNHKLQKQHTIK